MISELELLLLRCVNHYYYYFKITMIYFIELPIFLVVDAMLN